MQQTLGIWQRAPCSQFLPTAPATSISCSKSASFSRRLTSRRVRKGVMKTAAKVDTVVMHTERGTSALARKVTTLEATPPGQQATMQILHTSPTIISP